MHVVNYYKPTMNFNPVIINANRKNVSSKEYMCTFAEQAAVVLAHIDMCNRSDPLCVQVENVFLFGYFWNYKVSNNPDWKLKEGRITRDLYPTEQYRKFNGNITTTAWFYDWIANKPYNNALRKNDARIGDLYIQAITTNIFNKKQCLICSCPIVILPQGKSQRCKVYWNRNLFNPDSNHTLTNKHLEHKVLYMKLLFGIMQTNSRVKINADILEYIVAYL